VLQCGQHSDKYGGETAVEVALGLLQPGHLILILVIALVIVGPGKISGLGGALGATIRDFRKATQDDPAEDSEKASESKAAD
jgi:sec-independent protein translocase protein TatA